MQINLRALPSLKDYNNSELKLLASVAPAREFAPGTFLCREAMIGQSCFLLAIGSVNVSKRTTEGEKILATLRAGAIVGQMALIDRSPRSASVIAAEPTVALELTRDVFEGLLRASSPLALRFQEQIAVAGIRQLRLATERLGRILESAHEAADRAEHAAEAAAARPSRQKHLLTVQAALSEWDMTLEDLDHVRVAVPAGQIGAEELKSRQSGAR